MKRLLFYLLFIIPFSIFSQSAEKLFSTAKENYYRFQYTSSIQDFEKAKSFYLKNGDTKKALKCYYFLTMSYFELGQVEKALDELYEGSGLSIEKYGEESPQSGDFYVAYGKFYHLKESYDTAKIFYKAATELKKSESGTLDFGEIYANYAYTYDYNEQYDSALLFYKKSAEIVEHHLGIYHPYTEWVYASIPFPADQLGDHQTELHAALMSLDINKKLWDDQSDYVANSYAVCAVAYQHLGKYLEEKDCFQKALDIKIKIYGVNSPEAGTAYYDLGNAYARLNKFDFAIDYALKAYEIKKKILGEKSPETLKILRNIGNIYSDGGFYEKALDYYSQNLTWQQKLNKKGSPELIQPLNDIATTYEHLGKYDLALDFYKNAIALQEQHEQYKWMLSNSYISLARIFDERSDPNGAVRHLEKALEFNEKYNDNSKSEEAFINNNLGTVYVGMNEYGRAEQYLKAALDIRTELFGYNSVEVAQTLANLATLYMALEKYEEAERNYEQCQEIYEAYFGSVHLAVARLLVNMATLREKQGDLKGEIELLKKAEEINIQLNGNKSPELHTIYFNLSIAWSNLTNFTEAFASLEKATTIAKEIYGVHSLQMADIHNQTGVIKHATGRSYEAFSYHEKAIAIYKNILGENHTKLADAYNNIGLTYMEMNEFGQSKRYLEEAIRIYTEILGPSSMEVVTTKMNLGLIENSRSNYTKAIEIFKESIQLGMESLGKKDHPAMATSYQNLGYAYNFSGNEPEALLAFDECLEIREALFGGESSEVAHVLNNIGMINLKQGKINVAEGNFERVLMIYKKAFGEKSKHVARILNNLADVANRKGNYQLAMDLSEEAIKANLDNTGKVIDNIHYFISQVQKVDNSFLLYQESKSPDHLFASVDFLSRANNVLREAEKQISSEEDQYEFSTWKGLLTNIGVKNSLALFNETGEEKHIEQALYYAERSKANVLLNALNKVNARTFKGIDQELLQREQALKMAIQKADEELFKLDHKGTQHEQRVSALKEQIFEWNNNLNQVVQGLESNPRYKELSASDQIITLGEIQNRLITEEDQAIIEYAASDSTLNIFLITKNDVKVFSKPYQENFDKLVVALRNAIVYKSEGAFDYASKKLYELAMEDVENYLNTKDVCITKLMVVPEGPFNYIPFETLKRNDKYLIEDFDIRYSYSLSLSDVIGKRETFNVANSCLAFAPVFADAGTNTITSGAREVFNASSSLASEERGFSINGEYITPLPGTEREVNAIDKLMTDKGHHSELFIYANAKEDVIKSGALENHKYIHFATHGFVNEANPAFSGIFMSQNGDSGEDCILFASEIYNLNLHAELVTLSACETGLGKFANGEGIVGLTRAFLYAGAKNLLVSQWKVSDESTARMMIDFYDRILGGKNKATALREAKLALIADDEFSKPFYWAPFVLIGK